MSDELERLRADNARLLSFVKLSCPCEKDVEFKTHGHHDHCPMRIATTDSREWLREFGMKVAEATKQVAAQKSGKGMARARIGTISASAIVDGVMK